ncbi:MAG: efflux RND transporter permease subunit [Flavobacteriales bacterium]|nr:efflux RND transporter permease subunit [Flavobacteriales bacterium]
MKKLVSYFIRYSVSANVLLWLIVIFGFLAYFKLTSSFFPLVENRNITIQLVYPGSSPEEIEEGVVVKIEEELKGVTGVERITSTSQENAASIKLEVEKGFNTSKVLEDVKNAVNSINSFPDGLEKPIVTLQENLNFTVSFSLSGSDIDLHTLKAFARQVETDLLNTDGISKVELNGFPEEEIEVAFLEDALQAYNISFDQAAAAIRTSNIDITGGTIKTPAQELLIRGRNKGYLARELEDIVVKATPDGKVVTLKDVAHIRDRWADNPNKIVVNGERAVEIRVSSTDNENLLDNASYVRDYINTFNVQNDKIKATLITDMSVNLNERRDLLVKNGLIGMILVLVLLALFLNIRVAFWVAVGIPISFFGMILLAMYYGVTVNVISLFGMIVVLGILVDDGIVIAENIYHHYEMGKSAIKAAVDGTMEVIPAVLSAVFTTMFAFAFFFLVDGRAGDFFSELSFVVIATLGVSLIEALIILPSHMAHSKALKAQKTGKNRLERWTDKAMYRMRDRFYAPVLRFALNNRFLTVSIMVALLMVTFGAMKGGIVKSTFFPFIERDQVLISLTMPSGTRDYLTEEKLIQIEEAVQRVNAHYKAEREDSLDVVKYIVRKVGPKTHTGTVDVALLAGELRNIPSYQIENAIRKETGIIAGAEKLTYGTASPFGKPVSVTLLSSDYEQLEMARSEIRAAMESMTELKDVVENVLPGPQEIRLQLKEKAYLLGLNEASILSQVRQGFFGFEVQRLQRGVDEVKVWVRYDETDRTSLKNLEDMRIRTAGGGEYPLRELATYTMERGVININHLDAQRENTVEADLIGPQVSAPEVVETLKVEVMPNILKRYPNVKPLYEGQNREAAKTAASSKTALPVVLILILAIITFTFRSFGQTMVIFLLIPFSFIGVVWGHFIHGNQLSILSFLGIVALIGIIVNDSLVLVTKMNAYLKEGMKFKEAVFQAGYSRFRAIFLTSATTIAGLGPIILERSFQAQFLKPMAIAVAYGIGVATILTLILLPVFLVSWNNIRRGTFWIWNNRVPEPEEIETAVIELKSESDHED